MKKYFMISAFIFLGCGKQIDEMVNARLDAAVLAKQREMNEKLVGCAPLGMYVCSIPGTNTSCTTWKSCKEIDYVSYWQAKRTLHDEAEAAKLAEMKQRADREAYEQAKRREALMRSPASSFGVMQSNRR